MSDNIMPLDYGWKYFRLKRRKSSRSSLSISKFYAIALIAQGRCCRLFKYWQCWSISQILVRSSEMDQDQQWWRCQVQWLTSSTHATMVIYDGYRLPSFLGSWGVIIFWYIRRFIRTQLMRFIFYSGFNAWNSDASCIIHSRGLIKDPRLHCFGRPSPAWSWHNRHFSGLAKRFCIWHDESSRRVCYF